MRNEVYRNILSVSENIIINRDWLYHWILDEEMMYKVYKFGILSKENLRKQKIAFTRDNKWNVGCNGTEYVSVCKRLERGSFAYQRYIMGKCAFIISPNIEKINTEKIETEVKRNGFFGKWLKPKIVVEEKSIVNHPDEYLVKDKIAFSDIIGLKVPVFADDDDYEMLLNFLENTNTDLPIINVEQGLVTDKEKVKRYLQG